MMKQGIKMMESRTAFLLILITTDLHVGILSPPRLAQLSLPPDVSDPTTIGVHSSHVQPWMLKFHNILAPFDEITETLQ